MMVILYCAFIVLASFAGFIIYRIGVRDGMNIHEGKKPEKIKIPKRSGKKEDNDLEERIKRGMGNMLDYGTRHYRKGDK